MPNLSHEPEIVSDQSQIRATCDQQQVQPATVTLDQTQTQKGPDQTLFLVRLDHFCILKDLPSHSVSSGGPVMIVSSSTFSSAGDNLREPIKIFAFWSSPRTRSERSSCTKLLWRCPQENFSMNLPHLSWTPRSQPDVFLASGSWLARSSRPDVQEVSVSLPSLQEKHSSPSCQAM